MIKKVIYTTYIYVDAETDDEAFDIASETPLEDFNFLVAEVEDVDTESEVII